MKWDDELLTGVDAIDSGNKEIVARVNHSLDCVTEYSNAVNELSDTMNFLLKYSYGHFASEEELEREHNCPDFDAHKAEHDDFAARINDLYGRYLAHGESLEFALEANMYMADWYTKHVLIKDLAFSELLHKENASSNDNEKSTQ